MSEDAISAHAAREHALALRNGLTLASSLVLTWGVALVVTFQLPKYLGPTLYGHYKFGDTFAMSAMVFLGLGVDTYISREVAIRPAHASDFFGGVLVARALVLVPITLISCWVLRSESNERKLAAALFGVAYVFIALNQTLQQTLQAASNVKRLAMANVASKVLWGGGTLLAVLACAPFWVLPLPLVLSEAVRSGVLLRAVRRAVDLRIRLDVRATRRVLEIAVPFFVANIAVSLGTSVDVVVLAKMVTDANEVGYYGAARQIAQLSSLLSPILSGVLIPMMSRAKVRDEDEFFRLLRRGIEGVVVVSLPLTLLLALGAEFWVHLALRDPFLPASASLRWLAPTFVLAYVNVLLWLALMILGRAWTITVVSIGGLALVPILIAVFLPYTAHLGPGGAGMGTAMALSVRELIVAMVFALVLGRRAFDACSVRAIVLSAFLVVLVSGMHVAMRPLGPLRLILDAGMYGVGMLLLRIVRMGDIGATLRAVRNRRNVA